MLVKEQNFIISNEKGHMSGHISMDDAFHLLESIRLPPFEHYFNVESAEETNKYKSRFYYGFNF